MELIVSRARKTEKIRQTASQSNIIGPKIVVRKPSTQMENRATLQAIVNSILSLKLNGGSAGNDSFVKMLSDIVNSFEILVLIES